MYKSNAIPYNSHTIPSVLSTIAFEMKSINLIRSMAQQQRSQRGILQYDAQQVLPPEPITIHQHVFSERVPLLYNEYTLTNANDDVPRNDTDATQSTQATQSDPHDTQQSRTRCTVLESCIHSATCARSTSFLFEVRNLNTQDQHFTSKALDAIQQFVTKAREDARQNIQPFETYSPVIMLQPNIHVHAHSFLGSKAEKLQLNLRIAQDMLDYDSVILCNKQNSHNISLQVRDHTLHKWCGLIPHIDYKSLYESLDPLFAIVYANTDIRAIAVSEPRVSQGIAYVAFKGMHFPTFDYSKYIRQYTIFDDQGHIVGAPYMPLAFVRCEAQTQGESIKITELAHMSILLTLHKQFVPATTTFAFQLSMAIIEDIQHLWEYRQSIMPVQQECDLFAYGIIPVVRDILPQDYAIYLKVPQNSSLPIHAHMNTKHFMRDCSLRGTTEMCTWGCALAYTYAAMQESLPSNTEVNNLMQDIRQLACTIDIRFSHFHTNMQYARICNNILAQNVSHLSGGAMPLFCMAICNTLSLAQSLQSITELRQSRALLNIDKLIRIDSHIFDFITQFTQ